jgi:hypothetical protein
MEKALKSDGDDISMKSNDDSELAHAEEYKSKGNEFFKSKQT